MVSRMQELKRIRQIIDAEGRRSGFRVLKVLLFGSRARGDFRQDSDWDFYVVVDRDLSFPERQKIASRIRWALAQEDMDCDIVIQSERMVREREDNPAYLTYYVLKEGIEV